MMNFIRNLVAGKELNELSRWRSNWNEYRRWLSEFPAIAMMLDNMDNEVRGKEPMDACHPPGNKGPWTISNLRWHIRRNDPLQKAQARIAELEKQQEDFTKLLLEKNREVNNLRFVCGESYQLLGRYRRPNLKALENLCVASKGSPLPHTSFMKPESIND